MKTLKWLDDHLEEALVSFLLAMVSLLMVVQVILRYFFSSGLSWSEVICRYMLVMMGFISIGYSVRHKSSFKIDLLVSRLPRSLQKICDVIVWFLMLAILGIFFKTTVQTTLFYHQYGRIIAGTKVPVAIVYLLGPTLGLGLGLFRLFQNVVCSFLDWKKQKNEPALAAAEDQEMKGGEAE